MWSPVITSITDSELAYVAALDYGQDASKHLDALCTVIFNQGGKFKDGQVWHPYEVIELGSHALNPGHEREFAICTLLVISAVVSGFDLSTDLSVKLSDRSKDYDALPSELRDEVLNAYLVAGH
jgi:hypothetical protein